MSSSAAAKAVHRSFTAALSPISTTSSTVSPLTVVTYNILADKYATFPFASTTQDDSSSSLASLLPPHLEWHNRAPKILQEIENYKSDILCLQEVERPFMENDLGPFLRSKLGHEWLYYGRHRKPTDLIPGAEEGVCLSFNSSRLQMLASQTVRFGDLSSASRLFQQTAAAGGGGPSTPSFTSSLSSSFFINFLREREDGAVLALLKDVKKGKIFVAGSTHLFWNPAYPDVKAAQAHLLCLAIKDFIADNDFYFTQNSSISEENNTSYTNNGGSSYAGRGLIGWRSLPSTTPIILGGDFNSLPIKTVKDEYDPDIPDGAIFVSGAYQLLTQNTPNSNATGGVFSTHHQDHPLHRLLNYSRPVQSKEGRKLSESGKKAEEKILKKLKPFDGGGLKLASAAATAWGHEPSFTNKTSSFVGCLDYIFYTPKDFDVVEMLEMPYDGKKEGDRFGEEGSEPSFPAMPNESWPSDHLAVGARIQWK